MGFYSDRIEQVGSSKFERMSTGKLRQFLLDQTQALEALGIDLVPVSKAKDTTKR